MDKTDAAENRRKHRKAKRSKGSIGRPASNAAKKRWISFRLTEEEFFKIADKAQRSGMSHVQYARSRALAGVARRSKTAAATLPVFGDATRDVYHELRRQGVNLNQIAHHCNRHQVPPPAELQQLAAVIMALWQRLLPP